MKSICRCLLIVTVCAFVVQISGVRAATEQVVYRFCGSRHCETGSEPRAGLIDVKGTLYGTTSRGGVKVDGTVFALDPKTDTETVLYSFCSATCADGAGPSGSLINVGGTLYGTTELGGASEAQGSCFSEGCGTVFSIDPSTGEETVLHSFCSQANCADGAEPIASLIDVKGTLYGTTLGGGANDGGAVFALDLKTDTETVLYSFCGQANCADGASPQASLIDLNGTLYGTTGGGGANDGGAVFALDLKTGTETGLYSFCGQANCADGSLPVANLIDLNGTLYGTTEYGGASEAQGSCNTSGCGTVFSIDPGTGNETVLYSFCSQANCSDGAEPEASLIDVKGTLYGTAATGGSLGCGAVFSFDPNTGAETVLYSFCNRHADGILPDTSLIDVQNRLYGATIIGGQKGKDNWAKCPPPSGGCGTIFAVTP